MKSRNRRPLGAWEIALFLTPLLVLATVFFVSRLETLQMPQQNLIVKGQPLFTMQMRLKPGDPLEKMEIVHAVRTFNGTYKIYRVDKPTVVSR